MRWPCKNLLLEAVLLCSHTQPNNQRLAAIWHPHRFALFNKEGAAEGLFKWGSSQVFKCLTKISRCFHLLHVIEAQHDHCSIANRDCDHLWQAIHACGMRCRLKLAIFCHENHMLLVHLLADIEDCHLVAKDLRTPIRFVFGFDSGDSVAFLVADKIAHHVLGLHFDSGFILCD